MHCGAHGTQSRRGWRNPLSFMLRAVTGFLTGSSRLSNSKLEDLRTRIVTLEAKLAEVQAGSVPLAPQGDLGGIMGEKIMERRIPTPLCNIKPLHNIEPHNHDGGGTPHLDISRHSNHAIQGKRIKLPLPPIFGDADLASLSTQGKYDEAEARVDQLLSYISATGLSCWPGCLTFFFAGQMLVWVNRILKGPQASTMQHHDFKQVFMLRVTGQVRDVVHVALESLITHKITQGPHEPVAAYAGRFFQRSCNFKLIS